MKRLFKRADIILISILCLSCAFLLLPRFFSNSKIQAVIYENGDEIYQINLSKVEESYTIKLDCTPSVIIKVEHGAIRYLSSDCPDKLCVKAGRLTHSGDTAVCLPSKTAIVVKGNSNRENWPDVITY